MNAIHVFTTGMHCDACPPRIEADLESLPGVKAAVAYRSMRMTSVLFDPDVVDVDTIRDRIARAGFEARVLSGARAH